jgi:hypothetical protein
MEVSGQLHAPAALPSAKELQVSIVQKAGWAAEPIWTPWRREKSFAPGWNRTPAVPRHYIDWAIQARDD